MPTKHKQLGQTRQTCNNNKIVDGRMDARMHAAHTDGNSEIVTP